MEAHKTAEPKFARTLRIIYPHLERIKGLGSDQDSAEDDHNTTITLRDSNVLNTSAEQ